MPFIRSIIARDFHCLPDARVGRRHVEVLYSERAQRIDDGVDVY